MASTTQVRHRGWWCAPELLVALIVATTLLRGCSGGAPVPVAVSTVYSVSNVVDVAANGAGNFFLLTRSGAVHCDFSNGTTKLVATISSGGQYHGITCDVSANVAYVTSRDTNSVYKLVVSTKNISTFAGSGTAGTADGVGTAAQFNYPYGIVHYAPTGLLYVADYRGSAIRKIVVATVNVTTVATVANRCYRLCITANGTFLYVTTDYTIVIVSATSINNVTPAIIRTLAGSTALAHVDGVGAIALFNSPQGIVLNSDESALIIADDYNNCIRRLEHSTNNVTTIAGSILAGGVDGPGLSATFNSPRGARWHCNQSSMLCGVLVADSGNSAVRFVAIERGPTVTAVITGSLSLSSSRSTTGSRSTSYCGTGSKSNLATATRSNSTLLSVKRSASASHSAYQTSTSPTVYCALVPGGSSGALASLHRVDVLPAGATAVVIAGAEAPTSDANSTSRTVTGPVSRQALLGDYVLAANISLTLGGTLRGVDDPADGWALVVALLDVVAADAAFPVLSAPVEVTVASSRVAGREQLLVCLLRPPNGTGSPQWLPLTLSVFRDVTLRLRLTLRCPTDASVTQDVVVVIPSPGQAVPLAAEVRAAGVASQYASTIAAPAAGSAVGRLSAVRSLVLCSGDASVGGMLPLRAAVSCEGGVVGSSSAADARGAVLGNLVLWAAGCALMGLLTCGYSRCAAVSLRTAAEALGVPSPLLPLVVATVPSTASSTFVLLRSSCAADSAVAALGVAMCVAPLLVMWALVLAVAQRLLMLGKERTIVPSARCMSAHLILMRLLHRRFSWAAAPLASVPDVVGHEEVRALRLERVATVVLLEYAVVWYLCVDVAVLTAAGLLGAVSTLGSLAACRGSAVAVGVLYVGQLVLCAAVRPYTTLFSHVHTLFCLALGAVSVWCQVWYLFASARDDADLDALGALLAVSAVCDIVVSAASMLRTLIDVVEALRACRRHLLKALQLVNVLMARVDGSGTIAECPELGAGCTPPTLSKDSDLAADVSGLLAKDDYEHFWPSDESGAVDGDAFVLGAAVVGVGSALEASSLASSLLIGRGGDDCTMFADIDEYFFCPTAK